MIVEKVFGILCWDAWEIFFQWHLSSERELIEEVDTICLIRQEGRVSFKDVFLQIEYMFCFTFVPVIKTTKANLEERVSSD